MDNNTMSNLSVSKLPKRIKFEKAKMMGDPIPKILKGKKKLKKTYKGD